MRLIDADESVQHLKEDAELALEIKESGIYAGLYNAMEEINKQLSVVALTAQPG